jgi:hypothetical protein
MLLIPSTAVPDAQVFAAYIIFLASYLVFAIGKFPGLKIDRPGAAIIGAVAMIAFRVVQPSDALRFIDFSTLVLLFSMMLIVGNLRLVGFFEWNAEVVLRRLKPGQLLPAVIFTCGFLSAFLVNDIVCLVMVPFVLGITRRMRLQPLPYLLAVATASNIGSVATITGNPQNMLIGSFSGIRYYDFLFHLAPVAVIGLFLDWAVLHWIHMRKVELRQETEEKIPLPALDLSHLTKPVIVVSAVVIGFFFGVPPAMMAALGAAALLITRTLEPRKALPGSGLGIAGVFYRTVSDRRRSRKCRHRPTVARAGGTLEPAEARNVHDSSCAVQQYRQQCARGDAAEIVDPWVQQSAHGLVGSGHGFHACGQSDDHRERGQPHCGGERQAGDGDWFLGLFPGWLAHYARDSGCGMGMAGLDSLRAI